MNYKLFPVDKDGNDNIFVVIDRLTKKSISIPCIKKDATSLELTKMFIRYVYLYYGLPDIIVFVEEQGHRGVALGFAELY